MRNYTTMMLMDSLHHSGQVMSLKPATEAQPKMSCNERHQVLLSIANQQAKLSELADHQKSDEKGYYRHQQEANSEVAGQQPSRQQQQHDKQDRNQPPTARATLVKCPLTTGVGDGVVPSLFLIIVLIFLQQLTSSSCQASAVSKQQISILGSNHNNNNNIINNDVILQPTGKYTRTHAHTIDKLSKISD